MGGGVWEGDEEVSGGGVMVDVPRVASPHSRAWVPLTKKRSQEINQVHPGCSGGFH